MRLIALLLLCAAVGCGAPTSSPVSPSPVAQAAIQPAPPPKAASPMLPVSTKLYKGRTLAEWAGDLEDLDPNVIDKSVWGVQAFGEDGIPYFIVQAKKHAPGTEHRQLIAAFIGVPKSGPWRQPAIDFLHELTRDPAQLTADRARNVLKLSGVE